MALSCKQAGHYSLAVLGGHAAEAERLLLEEHLIVCARCGAEHTTVLAFVRGLDALVPESLTAGSRDFVRQVVVDGAWGDVGGRSRVRAGRWWGRRFATGLVMLAAAGVGAIAMLRIAPSRDRPYRVIDGDVTADPRQAATQAAGPTTSGGGRAIVFRSVAGGRVRVSEADVTLAPSTEIVWTESQRSVDLRQGQVTLDVEHHPGQHLQVRTPHFRVEVLGTRFTVNLAGVRTERGIVRAIRADGSFAAEVAAGQTWQVAQVTTLADEARATPPRAPWQATSRIHEAWLRPAAVASTNDTLSGARRALARGDATAARRIVTPLFHLGRDVGAEARVLFAESFLVEGRYADAIDGYRVVARDFPGTAQAESALFAIAQLDSEHGLRVDAHEALRRYLDRYPRGRFAPEAAARLSQLSLRER